MTPDELEYHAWPYRVIGGQQTGRVHTGVLVVHKHTGVAVVVDSSWSRHANQRLAEERIQLLLSGLPWSET